MTSHHPGTTAGARAALEWMAARAGEAAARLLRAKLKQFVFERSPIGDRLYLVFTDRRSAEAFEHAWPDFGAVIADGYREQGNLSLLAVEAAFE